MSDLRINIRFFMWHFQLTDNWKPSVTYNDFHKGLPDGWWVVYKFKPFKKKCGCANIKGG